MFGLGVPELIVIAVIALVVFGPGKLPEMGKSLGEAIRGFKKAVDEPDETKKQEPAKQDPTSKPN
jgi:sec-independent protein translocase protein TatA